MTKRNKKVAFNICIILLLGIALAWVASHFIHLGNVEFTDNAQVKQQIVPVHSRVQGFIKKIYFTEYQQVHKGDTLAIIEDAEFRYRLAQAEADYQNALSGKTVLTSAIHTIHNNISVSAAGVEEAQIRLTNAEREYNRYKNLLAQDAVTRQQFDAIETEYKAAKARYDLLSRQKTSTALMKQEQTRRLDQTDAGIKLAEAALEIARLNLSYTVILAPCDGTTGRKEIQEGQLIQPGQCLVDVVDENEKWVVANYKETQTANIQPAVKLGSLPYPVLTDVPVFMPIPYEINPGDACLVIFSDVDIDNWFETGEASAPNSPRRHSLSDGFAFVGFRVAGSPESNG